MGNIRLGVVGVGRIGQMHVENVNKLIDGMEVVAIADPLVNKITDWVDKQDVKYVYENYEDLVANPDVDAVLIACSTNLHRDVCVAAAKAGKHVICEKPLDTSIAKCEEMIKACDDAGVKLQVGFNRRFDHNFKKVRELVGEGKIGDPQILRIASRDPSPPPVEYVKVSGGIFMDMMIHDFDMIRYLSGCDVEEVTAKGAVLIDPAIGDAGDVDTAIVTLKMSNGALGVIDNSRQAVYGYDQRIEVFGSKGQALANNDKFTTVEVSTAEGECTDKIPHFFLDRYTDAYLDEFTGFVKAINDDTTPVVTGNDGLQALKIAKAATQSLKENRTVKLSEVTD